MVCGVQCEVGEGGVVYSVRSGVQCEVCEGGVWCSVRCVRVVCGVV